MSLKALVQLFAEKFLVSKKEWVAEQPAISPGDSITLSVTADGENHNFTMPCTGYANLRGYGVWFVDINGCALINLGPDANGNLSVYLYAKKGQQLRYAMGPSSQFSTAYINIYKAEGSK